MLAAIPAALWVAGLWKVEVIRIESGLDLKLTLAASGALAAAIIGLLISTAGLGGYAGANIPSSSANEAKRSSKDIQTKLETSCDQIFDIFEASAEANARYGANLATINDRVHSSTRQSQVLEAIEALVAENDRMQLEVKELRGQLENAHSQVKDLRDELVDAKEETQIDGLTKLRNRRWLDAHLHKQIGTAQLTGTHLCLAMLDVDHFKRVNDKFGHVSGDAILSWFGEVLRLNVKGRDTPVRYGGEEFALVLPRTKLDGAKQLAEQIRKEFEKRTWVHMKSGRPIGTVTASFGVVQLRSGESAEMLIERADSNLYAAKHAGRNCVIGST